MDTFQHFIKPKQVDDIKNNTGHQQDHLDMPRSQKGLCSIHLVNFHPVNWHYENPNSEKGQRHQDSIGKSQRICLLDSKHIKKVSNKKTQKQNAVLRIKQQRHPLLFGKHNVLIASSLSPFKYISFVLPDTFITYRITGSSYSPFQQT